MLEPVLLIVGLLSATGTPPADLDWPVDSPPEDDREDHRPACTKAISNGVRTILGIRLEQETLERFEALLGESPLHSEGDAGTGFEWRCWEAASGDGTILVVGSGELTAEFRILGPRMKFDARGTCPSSKLVSRTLATANGVRLGLTRAQVERKVGGRGWLDRTCIGKEPMTEEERRAQGGPPGAAWSVYSRITLVASGGRVEGIRVVWALTD